MRKTSIGSVLFLLTLVGVIFGSELEESRRAAVDWGIQYLRGEQGEDGLFSPDTGIGPTIIVLMGLLRSGVSPDDPTVVRGLDALLASTASDGGIYSAGGHIPAYESALAVSCLKLAVDCGADSRYGRPLARAEEYLRSLQYSEATGTETDDSYYGGVGYGAQSRPDLSCTQYFIDALHDMGAGPDDEAMQRALIFVSRCQNYNSGEYGTETAENSAVPGGMTADLFIPVLAKDSLPPVKPTLDCVATGASPTPD